MRKAARMSQLLLSTVSAIHRGAVSFASSGRRVLIADADAESRERRESQLRSAGCVVTVARTGFEAIVKASCQVPDLILIDASLPDIDGPETGRLITTCPVTSHIPIINLPTGRLLPQKVISRLRRGA
ncbi:MAG: response regulator [Vicinamibacterales bacterium]